MNPSLTLVLYLFLVGITGLVKTELPLWITAVAALVAAVGVAAEKLAKK